MNNGMTRRSMMGGAVAAGALVALSSEKAAAQASSDASKPGAFVYTEVQISVPFGEAPWEEISESIKQQPGFINKTWLSGLGTNSLGGFYSFEDIESAQRFVTGYFPTEAKSFGVAHNTRVFDASVAEEASLELNSPHFGAPARTSPGAFVYTELQINVPFESAPWRERNPNLLQTPGLISKVWLSGINTNTLGGFDAFETLSDAQAFAIDDFPKVASELNCAFYTRIFDATVTEHASRTMKSPYYT